MQADPESLAPALLESDRAYFEAGAEVRPLRGASMALLRGMQSLAAGCVVHRVRPGEIGPPDQWLDELECAMRAAACTSLRIYLDERGDDALSAALTARGAAATTEVGLVRMSCEPWAAGPVPAGYTLHAVETVADWCAKLAFHRASLVGPDGHAAPAELWVAMERRRAEAGYLQPYLVRHDGVICGAFALAGQGALCRLKNLVLHPGFRGRGIARHVVRLAIERASAGAAAVGCFAFAHHHALPMYRALGFMPVVSQREWVSPLPALLPDLNQMMGAGT